MRGYIAAPHAALVEVCQTLWGDEDVHVVGHANVPVLAERQASDQRVGYALGLQARRDPAQCLVQPTAAGEVVAGLPEHGIPALLEQRFVGARLGHPWKYGNHPSAESIEGRALDSPSLRSFQGAAFPLLPSRSPGSSRSGATPGRSPGTRAP